MLFLGDQDDVLAELGGGEVGDGHRADGDSAQAGAVDAGQQLAQGGLAGSRGADDGQALAGPHGQIDAGHHVVAVFVGEVHAARLDAVALRRRGGDLLPRRCARPSILAKEAPLLCSCSSQIRIVSIGWPSWRR